MTAAPPPLPAAPEPPHDCPRCPRLVAFRRETAAKEPAWHNAPVLSFGDDNARLLVVGLAPGLKGANRTGRPFTGDYAGNLLYATLAQFGFTTGTYRADPNDGLQLNGCMITNAVRCVPPQNKPVGAEIAACRVFLAGRIAALPSLRVIVALGSIAHASCVAALGGRASAHKFGHNAAHDLGGFRLIDSYHCSRLNTNTGRLTAAMFADVFRAARARLDL